MRRAAKVDDNQREIVRALRQVGASVLPMHTLGQGAPDIAVGWRGQNWFFEIKDGAKPPSARKLTPDEKAWHAAWQGSVVVVETVDQALATIGAIEG